MYSYIKDSRTQNMKLDYFTIHTREASNPPLRVLATVRQAAVNASTCNASSILTATIRHRPPRCRGGGARRGRLVGHKEEGQHPRSVPSVPPRLRRRAERLVRHAVHHGAALPEPRHADTTAVAAAAARRRTTRSIRTRTVIRTRTGTRTNITMRTRRINNSNSSNDNGNKQQQ